MEGRVVDGRYRISRWIGAGGMAEVYEAEHIELRRKVALKLVNHSKAAASEKADLWLARFQREARAVVATTSPHVAQVFDAGVDAEQGVPYMAMELLAGEDLRTLLRRLETLEPDVAFRIAAQVCRGLKHAHESGVVHRDVKPGNLFLHRSSEQRLVVKVLDFGVAKLLAEPLVDLDSAELTETGNMLGTPQYMSPEQVLASNRVDYRTDLWSLGVVLYKMLSGATPFSHAKTTGQAVLAICTESIEPVEKRAPWLTADQASVVAKALRRDPAQRFESADAMLRALLLVTEGQDALDEASLKRGPTPTQPAQATLTPMVSSAAILRDVNDPDTGVTARTSRPNVQPARRQSGAGRALGVGMFAGLAALAVGVVVANRPQPLPRLGVSTLHAVQVSQYDLRPSAEPDATVTVSADLAPKPEAAAPARPNARASVSAKATEGKVAAPPRPDPGAPAPPPKKPSIDLRPEFD